MRSFNLLLSLCLFSQIGLGQNNYRVIGVTHQLKELISTDFFIRAVDDQRAFRANLGIVNRGIRKDSKRPLIAEADFFDNLLKQMNSWLRPGNNAEPVIVKLRELYLWENQWANVEKGHIHLELAFAGASDTRETVIAVELSGEEMKVANGHAPRLEAAFFRCLQQYDGLRKNKMDSAGPVQPSGEPRAGKAAMMAASNFLGLWKEDFFPAFGSLRSKGILYRYELNRDDGQAAQPYYALMKGDRLYIWAGNYPGAGKYYTRVLEQGRYLFLIDEITIKSESELKPELGQFTSKVGIVIDMKTGVPQIVDDALMEKLMAPYPDLQEKYLFKDILKFPFQLTRVQNVIAEINRLEAKN